MKIIAKSTNDEIDDSGAAIKCRGHDLSPGVVQQWLALLIP